MNNADRTAELPHALREFFMRSHRVFDRLMGAHGASLARTKLLMFVASSEGPVRSADIIRSFGLAPRTVTEALDGLEREGLLQRLPDPHDRRVKFIRVTAAGQAVIGATEPIRRAIAGRIFDALSGEEQQAFLASVAKLVARIKAIEAELEPVPRPEP